MTTRNSKTPSRRTRKAANKIDVTAILTKTVKVGKQGREQLMTPFEVSLRALVKKALKERNLNAIQNVIEIALTYLVKEAPTPPIKGGVLVVPGRLTMESWAALFENFDKYRNGKGK